MAKPTTADKKNRKAFMQHARTWLQEQGKTQRWLADQVGIYHGYMSNLLTGKQVASEEVCRKVGKVMGPLEMDWDPVKGKSLPAGTVAKEHRKRQNRKKKAKRPKPKKQPKIKIKPKLRDIPLGRRLSGPELEAVSTMAESFLKVHPETTPDHFVAMVRSFRAGFTAT